MLNTYTSFLRNCANISFMIIYRISHIKDFKFCLILHLISLNSAFWKSNLLLYSIFSYLVFIIPNCISKPSPQKSIKYSTFKYKASRNSCQALCHQAWY